MKRLRIIGSIVIVLGLLIIGSAIPVLAHNPDNAGVTASSGVNLDQPTLTRLAQALELTPDELTSRLQAGETLSEIAEEQNISEEAVVAAIIAPYAGELELRVRYGYITQQQADAFLEEAQEHARALLEQDLSGAGKYGSYTWEEMEEYCGGMMGNGWGSMMGGGMMGRSMMGGWEGSQYGYGGMMGSGWGNGNIRSRSLNNMPDSGWSNITGRFWNGIIGRGWNGMTGNGQESSQYYGSRGTWAGGWGSMMGRGMMGGW